MIRFSGRQTQFYVDLIYGAAFTFGFSYLLFVGMDPRIAAFQGGLVLGYFLRVWENMTIYERILEQEVAQEAEEAVADEVETQVQPEAEEAVADEVEARISNPIDPEGEGSVPDEGENRIEATVEEQLADGVEAEFLDRLGEIDDEFAEQLRERLDDREASSS